MVDFKKLKSKKNTIKSDNPIEIFRRLPKPEGINDLYSSQTEILTEWYERRNEKDLIIKLHTGGGKTLVGLLIAQSTLHEIGEPVLYLTPTRQLVSQTLEKAEGLGINTVAYESGKPLNEDFVNGKAIMVASYNALFNGKSRFGIRGNKTPQKVGAIILDDAHTAFSGVRDSFTLEVDAVDDRQSYLSLITLFRNSFKEIDKLGTLDDITTGDDYSILEVPYWAWNDQIDTVREILRNSSIYDGFEWPLLRDKLHLCHALISKDNITITPILPLVDLFPTFYDAPRRIYMSATISDDTEIVRTFDANPESIKTPLKSRSLAGISERMILIPELMSFKYKHDHTETLLSWVAENKEAGSVVLATSNQAADNWRNVAKVAKGSGEVEELVLQLQNQYTRGPVAFANRYDGIDLPGDSCRLLVMNGLPFGTSNYDNFRATSLYGATTITRVQAQRIEQGMGRGARGSGDHCVILLVGRDISSWIAKEANFKFLTSATRAQLDMGIEISKEISTPNELAETINRSIERDKDWVEYHAETLDDLVVDNQTTNPELKIAIAERKSLNLWSSGFHEKAINKIEKEISRTDNEIDSQLIGWLQQFTARIANQWRNEEKAKDLQLQAFYNNPNLIRPKAKPPYRQLVVPNSQAKNITEKIREYRQRMGYLEEYDEITSRLNPNTSAGEFEESLKQLGNILGFSSERHDKNGEGPDVLWLLPGNIGFVIEAKSRKKETNALTKSEHGQLLVASEWFKREYPGYKCVRISVHPNDKASIAAAADYSYVLTYEKLYELIADFRSLLSDLCSSQLSADDLEVECMKLLEKSKFKSDMLKDNYLVPFESFKE